MYIPYFEHHVNKQFLILQLLNLIHQLNTSLWTKHEGSYMFKIRQIHSNKIQSVLKKNLELFFHQFFLFLNIIKPTYIFTCQNIIIITSNPASKSYPAASSKYQILSRSSSYPTAHVHEKLDYRHQNRRPDLPITSLFGKMKDQNKRWRGVAFGHAWWT